MMKARLKVLTGFLTRSEPWIFLFLALINLFPLFSRQFYPFMDAPAHLYNSGVIKQMLYENNALLNEYFKFNDTVVPNWMSHLIMAPLHAFLNPSQVEKSFLLLYYFLFPVSLRYCIRCFKGQVALSYFGFPLAYNSLILYSFYNFSMGLVFLLLAVGFFYKKIIFAEPRLKQYFILFLIITGAYLCHLVVLLVALLFMMLIYIFSIVNKEQPFIRSLFSLKTVFIVLAVLPAVLLLGIYLVRFHAGATQYTYLDKRNLMEHITMGRNLSAFGDLEFFNAEAIALVILALFFICLYSYLANFKSNAYRLSKTASLLTTVLILGLFLYLPDADGVGGYVSMRFCIMLFIVALLFISAFELNRRVLIAVVALTLYLHYNRLKLYDEIIIDRNIAASKFRDQEPFVEPNSFLFCYKMNSDWIGGHYYNYLCPNKPVVALQDYEASVGYFPLVFRDLNYVGEISRRLYGLTDLDFVKKAVKGRPVYLWVLGDINLPEAPMQDLKNKLEGCAILLNSNNFATLYKLK